MSDYVNQLRIFHDAVAHGKTDALVPLVKQARHNVISQNERISVYAKGYVIRLQEATLMDYPTLINYMGEESCEDLVWQFAKHTTSNHWDLNLYPIRLSHYMEKNVDDKAAVALAQLEAAITDVFWELETKPLKPETLASLGEEALGRQVFSLRSTGRLLELTHDANAYLIAYREERNPTKIEEKTNHLLVLRHENIVQRIVLDELEYTILKSLQNGLTFGDAIEAAGQGEVLAQNLGGYISKWLEAGVFQEL